MVVNESEGRKSAAIALVSLAVACALLAELAFLALSNPQLLPGTSSTSTAQYPSSTTTIPQQNYQNASLVAYALQLINQDRQAYGIPPVSLSYTQSGQQHADSMLQYGYFSHWDVHGLKPYMRYTLLNGTGAVSENIAYKASRVCVLFNCYGNIAPMSAVQQMEYSFVYNDSACCNDEHRLNILDPDHNQVSIGVAYDSGRIYLVQDFIDNYISWSGGTPRFSNGSVFLSGTLSKYGIEEVSISYDPQAPDMTAQQLNATSSYGYGARIAGVVRNSNYYYPGIKTIVADSYATSGSAFSIGFRMSSLTAQYGAGEYTVMVWLASGAAQNSSFVGATYTMFIDASGQQYYPGSV